MLRALARFFRSHSQLHHRPTEAALAARRHINLSVKLKRGVGEKLMGWDKGSPLGKLYAHYAKHTS